MSRKEGLPSTGAEIEKLSHAIIAEHMKDMDIDEKFIPVAARIIHATGDPSIGETLRFHPDCISAGVNALKNKRPIICDVNMLKSGLTRTDSEVICAISDAEVMGKAKVNGTTRAVAAMDHLAEHFEGAIIAIGNAPTALWRVIEIVAAGGPRPALVVGLPVGFVGAQESKLDLIDSDLTYISNDSIRGGSPMAAAAVNALAILSRD